MSPELGTPARSELLVEFVQERRGGFGRFRVFADAAGGALQVDDAAGDADAHARNVEPAAGDHFPGLGAELDVVRHGRESSGRDRR